MKLTLPKIALYGLILTIIFMNVAGCTTPSPLDDGTVTTMAIQTQNSTDLYLFPAVNIDNVMEVFENTTYHITRDGVYLGEFENNKQKPVYPRSDVVNGTNKTITFVPGDYLDILVMPHEEMVKTTKIRYIVPDKALDYVAPTLHKIKGWELEYDVRDRDYYLFDDANWTAHTPVFGYYTFTVRLDDSLVYDVISCEYDPTQISRVETGFATTTITSYKRNDAYLIDYETFDVVIYTKDFTETTVTCELHDYAYYLTNHGRIKYDVQNEDMEDLGLPNPNFNITLTRDKHAD